jgi:4-amino-4-deoxy-L-arabinose transferase-like glycosyltransferase
MTTDQLEHNGDAKNVQRFVAFVGVFILLLSQFLVFSQEIVDDVLLPPFASLGVVGLVIFILSRFIHPTPFWTRLAQKSFFSDRVFWILVGLLFSVSATIAVAAFMKFTRVNYIPVLTVWLLGAICYVYAFAKPDVKLSTALVVEWVKENRKEILTILAIMLFAAAVRFYKLGALPRVLDGDEGSVGLQALATTSGVLANPFAFWENFGGLYLQSINMAMRFFGVNPLGLRLVPAIAGMLAMPAVYLFARQIGGRRIALIATIILAFSHSHIHFSRIASVAYIQDTWLIPLELYLLMSGLEKKQSWRTALSGVLLAIHYSVYLTAQITTILILIYLVLLFVFHRAWFKPRLPQALAFWGGLIVFVLPTAYYAYQNPTFFLERIIRDGTFQSGWLQVTMSLTGQSAAQILFGRVVHAFLSLFYYPAYDFYGSPVPMMSMISGVVFLAGLGIALLSIRDRNYLLLNGYLWGSAVAVGIFATPPSADSYRILMALPAAMTIAAIGLDQILEFMGLREKDAVGAYRFSVGVILVSLIIFNLWTYFGDFAGRCRFADDLVGRYASYLGLELNRISNQQNVYMLSDDQYRHGTHPSAMFLSNNRPVTNFFDPVDALDVVSGETIVAPPPRIEELEAWTRLHPGGDIHYEYDCTTTILMTYRVP